MADPLVRLRTVNERLESTDGELAREMRAIRSSPDRLRALERGALELPAPAGGMPEIPTALETIVLRTGRPVLAVVNDEAQLDFADADSEVWRERLLAARSGLLAAIRAVGRIELQRHPDYEWVGTGWLVDPDLIVTNRHVADVFSQRSGDGFSFRLGLGDQHVQVAIDFLEEVRRIEAREFDVREIVHIEDDMGPDLAFLRIAARSDVMLADPIPLSGTMPTADKFVATIGYPARDSRIPDQALMDSIFGDIYNKKRLAPGQIKPSEAGLVIHDCSTLGGNSGSVVLDLATGEAVGLHFSGRFLVANYAVPAMLVRERLAELQGAERSRPRRIRVDRGDQVPSRIRPAFAGDGTTGTSFAALSCTIPMRVHVEIGTPEPQGERRTGDAGGTQDPATFESTFADYSDREGYQEDFLGSEVVVPLPTVTRRPQDILEFESNESTEAVLVYEHFSVIMNRPRRMCFFSAVNIDGKKSRKLARRGWRLDPRIPKDAQIMQECYGNPPKFSRGHMTRREDPIWGTKAEAGRGNSDSMHVTNTVPQMQPFNAPVWLGLEDYALEHAREDDMRISVFTGPFLRDDDPELFGVRVPRSFWKVIAFIHDETGELCATGYTMSQEEFLAAEEFIFGQYTTPSHQTTQVAISAIEQRAGLSLGPLVDRDPLGRIEGPTERRLSEFTQIRFV